MSRKQGRHVPESHDRWLVSYADFITLLFAFFVVMFASSQADKGRAKQVSESVKKAFQGQSIQAAVASILGGSPDNRGQGNLQMKGPGGSKKGEQTMPPTGAVAELVPSLRVLTRELHEEIHNGNVKIALGSRGLTISFSQAALFPSGGDDIAPESHKSIEKVANAIKQLPNPVRLEGHTDSVPIHNARFRSNWELSAARSIALLGLITGEFGAPRDRFSIAGYADTAPVANNDSGDGRARNRRVDIVILNEAGSKAEPERYQK